MITRASSMPPQHLNNPKPRKVTHSTTSQPIPGDIMRRRNSTPGWMTAQDQNKGKAYPQVKSKKMELKFGMSPLKTQQFSAELIKSQKKTEKTKKESGKTNLESGFGRSSFRLPKINSNKIYPNKLIIDSENNTVINKLKSSHLNNMDARHKVKDWLNERQRTPRASLRRSVSDFSDKSRMRPLTQAVGERKDAHNSRGDGASVQRHLVTKFKRPKENETSIPLKIGDKNEDKEQPAKIVIKTKAIESQPKSLLRRSVSDLKQKSLAARKFLNYHSMRADVYRSPMFQTVTNYLEGQGDSKAHIDEHDLEDISNSKENIAISYVEEKAIALNEHSRQDGSILKRPGNKRKSIKHVEFLDNIGDDQDTVIRYI